MPGTVRKEESDYYGHVQATAFAAKNEAVPQPDVLQNLGFTIGCSVLLGALYRSLNFLDQSFQSWWPDAQRKVVESFVRAPSSSPPLLKPLMPLPTGRLCSGISSPGFHPSHSLFSWSTAGWRSRSCGVHGRIFVPTIFRVHLLCRRAPKMAIRGGEQRAASAWCAADWNSNI